MPKVNFYLLKHDTAQARQALACRLAEQQSKQGQRLYIQTVDQQEAVEMDKLLWSFSAESFVPHVLREKAADGSTEQPLVVIGSQTPAPADTFCVLNLTDQAIEAQNNVSAIAEFILNNDQEKARSRVLWQHYKQQGFELQLHQL
jgi:DNA polymerase III subunit chi